MAKDPWSEADGTYDPAPPPFLADPLAGLVTGLSLPGRRWDEIPLVSAPAMPDTDEIREAVAAALAEESPPATPPASQPPTVHPQPPPLLRPWPTASTMARKLRATKERQPPEKPASARTGISVVTVIVLVTVILLYYVVSSLADTFGKLF
ncbi:hypothetical protein JOF56_001803 [Kibdelosporangium banguiense]|uniref:Uncharacterized protein n=1 Tax=Kibdelosporangium banguiense TaxID=1365924 RepID=A0ABS4TAI1_9PSEU|nr:hypothetical protein [Kibdelosporangium banguiense]MBP2321418.1 hypothetical protein [Kibdelosporangium banguiense]